MIISTPMGRRGGDIIPRFGAKILLQLAKPACFFTRRTYSITFFYFGYCRAHRRKHGSPVDACGDSAVSGYLRVGMVTPIVNMRPANYCSKTSSFSKPLYDCFTKVACVRSYTDFRGGKTDSKSPPNFHLILCAVRA